MAGGLGALETDLRLDGPSCGEARALRVRACPDCGALAFTAETHLRRYGPDAVAACGVAPQAHRCARGPRGEPDQGGP